MELAPVTVWLRGMDAEGLADHEGLRLGDGLSSVAERVRGRDPHVTDVDDDAACEAVHFTSDSDADRDGSRVAVGDKDGARAV